MAAKIVNGIRIFLRTLASVWVSLVLLIAAIAFLSCASVFPDATARILRVDKTSLYSHWILLTIASAGLVNFLAALAMRRSSRRSLGAMLCHIGAIMLAVGAGWNCWQAEQGYCVTQMGEDGSWLPIDTIYEADRLSLYAWADEGQPLQTPLAPFDSMSDRRQDVTVSLPQVGATIVARRSLRNVCLEERISELTVEDGQGSHDVKFTDGQLSFQAKDYLLIYRPGTTVEQAVNLIGETDDPIGGEAILIISGPAIDPIIAVVGGNKLWHKRFYGSTLVPVAEGFVRVTPMRSSMCVVDGDGEVGDALEVEVSASDFRYSTFIPFVQFAHLSPRRRVALPGGKSVLLSFSLASKSIGEKVDVSGAEYIPYPGTSLPKDFICRLSVGGKGMEVALNRPVEVNGWKLSQGSWLPSPENARMIALNASYWPGLTLIWLSFVVMAIGMILALLVKPFLERNIRQ